MSHYMRLCCVLVAAGLTIYPSNHPAEACEAWTCFEVIKDKKIRIRYVVSGGILLHGNGSSHSKILVNDDKLLISSATDTLALVRHPKNSRPVEINEPIIVYFVMHKARNRLFTLSNYLAALMLDRFDKLIDPDMDTLDCTKD